MTGRMLDKVAFITGASEGIGRATAIRLAQEGATLVICARRPGPLMEVQTTIRAQGGAVETIVLDVSDTDAYARAIVNAGKRFGRLDALINNAMSFSPGAVVDMSIEAWRRDFVVNTEAVFVGTREALRIMYRQQSGSVVNVSSISGLRALPNISSYSASKAALVHFSAVAAMEAAPNNVRVNVIAPGQILTPGTESYFKSNPELAARSAAAIPARRSGQPAEIANAVLFLVSDESAYINGVCLPVDGGKIVQLYNPS